MVVKKRSGEKSRFAYLEDYKKYQNELSKDLNVFMNMSFIRPLESFLEHPLLRLIIPLLKTEIHTVDLSVAHFIEIALLLSEKSWYVDEYNISCINKYFDSFYGYDDKNRPTIMQEDYKLLDEFVMLLIRYERNANRRDVSYYRWPCLISREEFFTVAYKELHANEEVCRRRLKSYFHSLSSSDPVHLIARPFMDLYLKIFIEEHQFEKLYNGLCAKGNVLNIITESGKVSREEVLARMHLPIALCYIIALDKLTASGVISDKWIMDNMSPQYIDAFRPLWWECSVCAKYSEVSGYRLDFEKKVQRSLTLAEMETGEKLIMEENYLQTTNLSIENSSQWISDTESGIKDNADFSSVIKKDPLSVSNSNNITSKEENKFRRLIVTANHSKEEILGKLHGHIDNQKYKYIGCVLCKAQMENLISQIPSKEDFCSEFGNSYERHWEAIRKYTSLEKKKSKNVNAIMDILKNIVFFKD